MLKLLLKVRLRAWLAYFSGSGRNGALKNKGGKGKAILFAVLYIYLAAVFIGMFFAMFTMLASTFYGSGLGWFYFSYFLTIAFALMFIFSIFAAKAQLFEARDNDLLLSMPVKPSAILGSRMAGLLMINFGSELLVAVPAAAAWIMNCPVSPLGCVSFVLACLALPFFSLALSSFVGWLLALLTAKARKKNLISMAFSLGFLAVYFYVYSNINTLLQNLILNSEEISGAVKAVLPLYWLGKAMSGEGVLGLVLGLMCLIIPFVIAYLILSRSFIRTATTKHSAAKRKYVQKQARVAGAFSALYRRELGRFFSSSTYMMNSGMSAIMSLVLAAAILVKGRDIVSMLAGSGEITLLIKPIVLVALCALAATTTITACAVSLEGKNIWIVRSMPVAAKKVLMAKLALHLTVSAPAMLIAQIACIIVLKPAGLMLIWMLLLPQAYNLFLAFMGLWANLKFPKLDWQTETQAVKQGLSVGIPILGGWGIMVVPVLLAVVLGMGENVLNIVAGVFLLLVLLGSFLFYRWCCSRGVEIFEKL